MFKVIRKISMPLILAVAVIFFSACSKNDDIQNTPTPAAPAAPVVSVTDAAGGITSTTANTGGTVSSSEGLTASGVVWSSSNIQPTLANSSSNNVGTLTGSFVTTITGLTPNTMYNVKAYATNAGGTTYGPRITFTTLP